MARGTLLSTLIAMLKAEIGDFSGTNAARDAELRVRLSNKQIQLVLEHDWSFLERRWNVNVPAGTQFLAFPTVDADFSETAVPNIDDDLKFEVQWNNQFYPIMNGIGRDQYNLLDPKLNQRADPIQRWREASNIDETVGANEFEVWPLPVSPQVIRLTGNRNLLPLVVDTDKADLDDMLLVLGVATDELTRTKQPDAQIKGQMFARRLFQVGARNRTTDRRRIMGGSGMNQEGDRRTDIKLVAIH